MVTLLQRLLSQAGWKFPDRGQPCFLGSTGCTGLGLAVQDFKHELLRKHGRDTERLSGFTIRSFQHVAAASASHSMCSSVDQRG